MEHEMIAEDTFPDAPEDTEYDFTNVDQILQIGKQIKLCANFYFKKEEYETANKKYRKALKYLNKLHENDMSPEQESSALQVELPCLLNSAACLLRLKRYDSALEALNEALDISPDNPKALYRRGQAYHGMRDYDRSLADLLEAQKLSPNNKAISSEIAVVNGEIQAYKSKERKAYSKLFS